MLEGKTVAVVIPAFNEEDLICETLAGIPEWVDRIIVVDDCSKDDTAAQAGKWATDTGDGRLRLICHPVNLGVGAAIITGYQAAAAEKIAATAVMAADNQMPPTDLEKLVLPVVRDQVDYAKANRLWSREYWRVIPRTRRVGNAVLSLLTKVASGYWHVADSQTGFTVISLEMLQTIDLERIYARYGFPNDMLVHLNIWDARVQDFPSRPVYGVGEKSGIRLRKVIPRIGWLLVKGFFFRLWEKYVIRDFHPLVFFYLLGGLMTFAGLGLGILETVLRFSGTGVSVGTVVLIALLMISGSQFTLFAMWFDSERARGLRSSGRRFKSGD